MIGNVVKKIAFLFGAIFMAAELFTSKTYAWDGSSTGYNGNVYAFRFGSGSDQISWTTNAWDTSIEDVGGLGYTVYTNRPASATNKVSLSTGTHKYSGQPDYVYISKWVFSTDGICCHQGSTWHGITDIPNSWCLESYQNRYIGYCADCGESIHLLVTGDTSTLKNLYKIKNGSSYYYLCPLKYHSSVSCGHMEQGATYTHTCSEARSYNRYGVKYEINVPADTNVKRNHLLNVIESGFMYNNATSWNGKSITPKTILNAGSVNDIAVYGYTFDGWYTEAEGGTKVTTWDELQAATPISKLNENYSGTGTTGVITVYAHWTKCEGTLILDDECTKINKTYNAPYVKEITVPAGVGGTYTVLLNANGGSLSTTTLTCQKVFDYWQKVPVFNATFDKDTNVFENTYPVDGATFTLKAIYEPSEVILPTPSKKGYEFLGWTENGTDVVARGGDTYTVTKDTTLIASWNAIELSLQSTENYSANSGFGAVDLSWLYSGTTTLTTFRAYRSAADKDDEYVVVKASDSIATESTIDEKFTQDKTYTVPESGYYTIELYGGKGSDYGSYAGGKGGYVYTKVFLKKGQVITINPGTAGSGATAGKSTAGFSGGAGYASNTSSASSGGAASAVYIDGFLFAIAGGGGAAGKSGAGGDGGNTDTSTLVTTSVGQTGFAAGGGGYLGGIGSTNTWTSSSGRTYSNARVSAHICSGNSSSGGGCYTVDNYHYNKTCGHNSGDVICGISTTVAVSSDYSNCTGTLNSGKTAVYKSSTCTVCGGTGKVQEKRKLVTCSNCGGSGRVSNLSGYKYTTHTHTSACIKYYYHTHSSSCYHYCSGSSSSGGGCYGQYVHDSYGKSCGYSDGTNVTYCLGGLGGSNYIDNTAVGTGYYINGTYQNSANSGVNNGAGYVEIKSVSVGFQMDTEMYGVYAPDVDGPTAPTLIAVVGNSDNKTVNASWSIGKDVGTTYYFYVNSYNMSDETVVTATSNKTYNVLTSGLAGYVYLVDDSSSTQLTTSNSKLVKDLSNMASLNIALTSSDQYLHIAYEDVAGNIGSQIDVYLGRLELPPAVDETVEKPHGTLATPIITLLNDSDEGVYLDGTTVYINADGQSEAEFKITGTVAPAYDWFRINKLTFKEGTNTSSYSAILDNNNYASSDVTVSSSGTTYLTSVGDAIANISYTSGSEESVDVTQRFTINEEESFALTPEENIVCDDCGNETTTKGTGYTVKGDKTKPTITVTPAYSVSSLNNVEEQSKYLGGDEDLYTFKCAEGTIKVTITATDTCSGIQSVDIYSSQMTSGTPVTSGNGSTLSITEDGSYEYTIVVKDNVGNTLISHIEIDKDTMIPLIYDNTVSSDVSENDHDSYIPKTPAAEDSMVTTTDTDTYSYVYGWTNFDILLKYKASDLSGIKSMKLYDSWSETGTVIATGESYGTYSMNLSYIASDEGISKYMLVVIDGFNHKTTIKITTKIDKTPITITGFDLIKNLEGIDISEMTDPINITITGHDIADDGIADQSGIRDFSITVENHDNGKVRVYSTNSELASDSEYVIPITSGGMIAETTINILESDSLWRGDWTVTVEAVDIAWNESSDNGSLGEFSLKATLNRKLYSDVYSSTGALQIKAGEAVILKIVTGGYADLVEVDLNELMDKGCSVYTGPAGEIATTYDPKSDYSYDTSRVKKIDKPIDYIETENTSDGSYTIYYQIVFPVDVEYNQDGESYSITINAYKNITYTIDENGDAVIDKDGKKIQVNAGVIPGTVDSLSRTLNVEINHSITEDYWTVLGTTE